MLNKKTNSKAASVRVLVVDDQTMVVDALRVSDHGIGNFEWVQAASYSESMKMLKDQEFGLVLVDPQSIFNSRLSSIEKLLEAAGDLPVAIFSDEPDIPLLAACIERGVSGFISKKMPIGGVLSALTIMMLGQRFFPSEIVKTLLANESETVLTSFQKSVLKRASEGFKNKEIGSDLGISESQVKSHINIIRKKLAASNRAHAVVIAQKLGLL